MTQSEALAILKTGANVFLTGEPGAGKSHTVNQYVKYLREHDIEPAITASTGIAATHIGGMTIHAWSGIGIKDQLTKADIQHIKDLPYYAKRIKKSKVLIIDEVSMLDGKVFALVDRVCQGVRDSTDPFGGLQVVFFGDLFQLPPVLASDAEATIFRQQYATPYFFSAKVFRRGFPMEMLELSKVYRQEQRHFLRLLDAVRLNEIDYEVLEELNERCEPDFQAQDFYITLSSRNANNSAELAKIALPEERYIATITGEFNPSQYPVEPALRLKLNAQVMFLKNDPERRFVNGSIGKVIKLDRESVTVMLEDKDEERRYVEVQAMDWEVLRYRIDPADPEKIETEVIGTFSQIPLRLAWAVTIHKAQGKTFDKVIIDMDKGAFEHGQTYVALSRCRTLEGIVLRQPLRPQDIRTDERVTEFYRLMM